MKKRTFILNAFMAFALACFMPACSDDDPAITPEPETPVTPEEPETPAEPEEPVIEKKYNFDLYVCAVKHGGMSQNKNGTFVRSVNALTADQPMVDFTGKGIDITQNYTMESITKGKYYYQVPQSPADRFTKFQIVKDAEGDEAIQVIAEVPFLNNTYYARKYTHAWIDDHTLVVIGTDSKHTQVFWSKLKDSENSLTIESEGTLPVVLPEDATALSTSGILTYRESDGKLYYFTNAKGDAGMADATASTLHIVTIDPATMEILSDTAVDHTLAEETTASAYGELMQNTVMYDEAGNLYLSCLKVINEAEYSSLLRINAGETTFDPNYNGFPEAEGKLLTIQYLGGGKALAYSQDVTLGTKIDSESHFYTIVDLASGARERVQYEGKDLPYCGGRFSQRSVVVDGKAYIGITEGTGENDYPCVYIYDCATGSVEKGIQLSKGFCFDIIRVLDAE
ncbi:MAG: hypothetical protein ACI30I_00720 [Parabacteroides sp.]